MSEVSSFSRTLKVFIYLVVLYNFLLILNRLDLERDGQYYWQGVIFFIYLFIPSNKLAIFAFVW